MSGTRIGGLKTREKNLAKNPNYYQELGALGGAKSNSGGFASEKVGKDGLTGRERAGAVGGIGGKISRRGKRKETNPEWNTNQNSASSRSTMKRPVSAKASCVSCGRYTDLSTLDECGLCPNCPLSDQEREREAEEATAALLAEAQELNRRYNGLGQRIGRWFGKKVA